jgi:outer membrane protein
MKKLIASLILVFCTTTLFAQQYGHCNFGELLSLMPETESSETALQAFNDTLVAQGEAIATKFDELLKDYNAAKSSGSESPIQLGKREQALQKLRSDLLAFEQKSQGDLNSKRNELLEPVINRANEAIKKVAETKGFKLIFDTSVFNAVLFAEESVNILPLVKAELGIED